MILGSILFTLYINELFNLATSDTAIVCKCDTWENLRKTIKQDLGGFL